MSDSNSDGKKRKKDEIDGDNDIDGNNVNDVNQEIENLGEQEEFMKSLDEALSTNPDFIEEKHKEELQEFLEEFATENKDEVSLNDLQQAAEAEAKAELAIKYPGYKYAPRIEESPKQILERLVETAKGLNLNTDSILKTGKSIKEKIVLLTEAIEIAQKKSPSGQDQLRGGKKSSKKIKKTQKMRKPKSTKTKINKKKNISKNTKRKI